MTAARVFFCSRNFFGALSFTLCLVSSIGPVAARSLEFEVDMERFPRLTGRTPGAFAAVPLTFVVPPREAVVDASVELLDSTASTAGIELRAEFLGDAAWRGHRFANVVIEAFLRTLKHAPQMQISGRVRVRLETRAATDAPVQRLRPSARREQMPTEFIRGLANPEDLTRWAPAEMPRLRKAGAQPRGFAPSFYPDLEGSPVEYLILTDASMVAEMQILADWKTRRGVPTVVRSLDWVLANSRQGSDTAETIRNFILDAYQLWGIRWLLLGADTGLIPARMAYSTFTTEPTFVPSDLYYACLDGSWNANANGLFGEVAVSAMDLGDQVDLFPEVFVSRAPLTTAAEAQVFVQKTIGYETPLALDYQDDTLILAEVISPADYDSGAAILLDGADLSEILVNDYLPLHLDVRRLYETPFLYPGSSQISKAVSLDSLAAGPHFVNHMGHGFRFNMSVGDGSIVNPEAEALLNGDRSFILFLLNCTAMAYDSNALGERYLLAPNGGAVGVVGSSREAFPNSSIAYNLDFYSEVFANGGVHLGQAVVNSRLPRTIFTFFDTADRWTHFILNVLGDPELMMFTSLPRTANVSHPDSIDLGGGSVLVHVEADAAPVDSARICLWKDDEAYSVGWTDAAGDVTLAVAADTPGAILVTVSGRDLATYLGSIEAHAPAPPHPYVLTQSIIDDGTNSTLGNSDGLLDAGETVQISFEVANSGAQVAAGVSAELVFGGAEISLLSDSLYLGDIPPADSLSTPTGTAAFLVQVDPFVADATTVEFQLQFSDSSGTALRTEFVRKVVKAPASEIVEVLKTANGSSSELQVMVKNFGSGEQPAWSGVLSSSDPDITLLQDTTSFTPIASYSTGTSSELLQVTEADTTQANRMLLDLTDGYGRTLQFEFDLREPSAPQAPDLDASPGPTQISLTWLPSSDADLLGYHVYRRPFGVGNLERVNIDVVRAAYFLDTGLTPSTRYEYAIAAIDSSGLSGALSAITAGSTNPPQLSGWPLPMQAATSSSVALGDIDGDGDVEIVVGDAGIYAWHADTQEVRDGDNDALSWGVFTSETVTITGGIALAELAPTRPGLEIIAAAWPDNRIFAYDGAGDLLNGWPVQPSNGGSPGYWGTPTAVDLDGDGIAEILAISKNGHLYGFNADGTPLVGANGSFGTLGAFTRTSPTCVNLDADSELEIVVGGADGWLRAFNLDGSIVSDTGTSWPLDLGGSILSSPSVGEIDGDPSTQEIVVTSENDLVHVFDVLGNALPGWPRSAPMNSSSVGPSPALGDLNDDGQMEIVVVANGNPANATELLVYDGATGGILLQKNLENSSESSPILADLNGNGSVDVLVGGESGVIHAWELSGDPIDGFPLTVGDFVRSTPVFADVDQDGDAEIVLSGWDQNLYIWDLDVLYDSATAPWPTFAHDMGRSGRADVSDSTSSSSSNVPRSKFRTLQNIPNPFNPSTTILFEIARDGRVQVEIFDTRGRLVRRLFDDVLEPGSHRVQWNGRDDAGRALATGVYWYSVDTPEGRATRKMVLLR